MMPRMARITMEMRAVRPPCRKSTLNYLLSFPFFISFFHLLSTLWPKILRMVLTALRCISVFFYRLQVLPDFMQFLNYKRISVKFLLSSEQ